MYSRIAPWTKGLLYTSHPDEDVFQVKGLTLKTNPALAWPEGHTFENRRGGSVEVTQGGRRLKLKFDD